ncbi:hypothetical protein E0485_02925 [Paenibacillus albiflavus]|uniref:Uncharacterized protein n=1 Tax=Paenibacillus albiflavus TaxID=2545760 RepID=A0A4R4ENQ9_9BACL|nr:hypothetical protein [Paenibacillus albiflavus]TCZ81243.1 hypothetical protein E0485_02925 [Paenibacillus albiflavus]
MSEEEKDSHYLPARKQIHRSEKGKWAILFYRILLTLLVLLVIGLGIWGVFFTGDNSSQL